MDLSNTNVESLAPIATLTNLRRLDCISQSHLDLSPLHGLRHLRELLLHRYEVRSPALAALHEALPECRFDLEL